MKKTIAILLTVVMFSSCITLTGIAAEPTAFTDISGHWAEKNIQKIAELGLMNGVSDTEFKPDEAMTRAMVVTVLYRLDTVVRPEAEREYGENHFADVPDNSWFTNAVLWASRAGVVNGITATTFAPGTVCTREQTVTMIYRYLNYLGFPLTETTYLGQFRDVTQISVYARMPLIWAVAAGLVNGTTKTTLSPKGVMTRAQFATLALRILSFIDGTLTAPAQIPVPGPVESIQQTYWVDGSKLPSAYAIGDMRYIKLSDLTECETSVRNESVQLETNLFGKKVTLVNTLPAVWINGKGVALDGPALLQDEEWYVPASVLTIGLGFSELEDSEFNQTFYTPVTKNREIPAGYHIPVLMYHAVSDEPTGVTELHVSPKEMEEQIKAILDAGCTTITFEDLKYIDQIPNPVMLTFDDGYLNNYTNLYPLLKKYNVKATFFVTTSQIGNATHMSEEQLKEMSDSGLVSIQSHTVSHCHLSQLTEEEHEFECYNSMLVLARITGRQPFVLSYPYGDNNALTREVAARYYEFGICVNGGPEYITGKNPYQIYRYYIPRGLPLSTFLTYIT